MLPSLDRGAEHTECPVARAQQDCFFYYYYYYLAQTAAICGTYKLTAGLERFLSLSGFMVK